MAISGAGDPQVVDPRMEPTLLPCLCSQALRKKFKGRGLLIGVLYSSGCMTAVSNKGLHPEISYPER